jgi:hypothetical protein
MKWLTFYFTLSGGRYLLLNLAIKSANQITFQLHQYEKAKSFGVRYY